jgi:hypothetical protein
VGRTNNTRNALIAKREAALSRARTWQTTIRGNLVSQLHEVNWLFCAQMCQLWRPTLELAPWWRRFKIPVVNRGFHQQSGSISVTVIFQQLARSHTASEFSIVDFKPVSIGILKIDLSYSVRPHADSLVT